MQYLFSTPFVEGGRAIFLIFGGMSIEGLNRSMEGHVTTKDLKENVYNRKDYSKPPLDSKNTGAVDRDHLKG